MILVQNKVVIAIMDNFEEKPNGRLINGCIYPMGEVVEVTPPSDIIPQKYCYTEADGFYINPVWEQSVEQEVQKAIDNYTLELINGGMI